MSVILPRNIEQMAERRASEAGFQDVASYLAHLIAADARDASDDALEGALLEGLEGDGGEWDAGAMRAECRATLTATEQGS
ncbi:hypothetical protein D3093_12450 [Azospirillum argentinense]|uniref:Antitoxin ParD1/3/4 n=1 Tax=Azospirillum argentinense TaxID=2970906 RepID=A0A4D8PF10_9PROT|nr:hypothetical protein [Azospirillum argentinense]QCN96004.1 hypothetical protein D3093_12450 [Azospirillum argentinense]